MELIYFLQWGRLFSVIYEHTIICLHSVLWVQNLIHPFGASEAIASCVSMGSCITSLALCFPSLEKTLSSPNCTSWTAHRKTSLAHVSATLMTKLTRASCCA